jgi:hypothetical protein
MTTSGRASRIRIFISYRRDDAAYPAGWLFDRLVDHYGSAQVFKDVDSIGPGEDFAAEIRAAVGSCAVLLAVIGSRWLTAAGPDGQRRVEDPDDFVRLEIEAALARGTQVIPVLVDGASIPSMGQLPVTLRPLASRQALELSPRTFGSDFGRLLAALENVGKLRSASAAGRAHGHVWWAMMPVLSLGLLLPVPCVHAAIRMRNLELWVVGLLYVIFWVTLLSVIGVQSSLGHLSDALVASGWFLFGALIATMHALRLRRRAFSG